MAPIRGRAASSNGTSAKGTRLNSLGVGERDLPSLLDKLDESQRGAKAPPKREYTRLPFRQCSLTIGLEHPGGSRAAMQVICRNMSRGGVGVLHSAFVHTGTRCIVQMPRLGGKADAIEGVVVRCTHVAGQIHELGIRFDSQIALEQYMNVSPLDGQSTFERVDPHALEGTAVMLLASEIDARMIGHFLSETRIKLKISNNSDEAASFLRESCDIAVIDFAVPCAEELVLATQRGGTPVPVLAIAADSSHATRVLIESLGVAGLLHKPLNCEQLLGMLAECLLTKRFVSLASDGGNSLSPALIAMCVEQLHGITNELRDAAEGDDPLRCYALCQQIMATCATVGLNDIGAAAERAYAAISQSMSVPESRALLHELLRLCDRVRNPS